MFHVKHSFLTWGYTIRNAKNVKEGSARDASVDVPYTARPAPVDGKEGIEPMTIAALAQGAQARVRAVRTERAARTPAERTAPSDVLALSMPLFVELFMQIMIGNINQFMLAPLGTQPVAAVGNALQILNIVTIALSAMGTASTVLVLSLIHI